MNDTSTVDLLFVEHKPQDLELALLALREANPASHIHIARDGAEAVEVSGVEGPHAGRRSADMPKVILLDLKLPKIDGLDVLKRIKSDPRTKLIPIVMLTSSKEQRDVIESYQLGVNSYIVKPVNFERFTEAVRNLGIYWQTFNQPPKVTD